MEVLGAVSQLYRDHPRDLVGARFQKSLGTGEMTPCWSLLYDCLVGDSDIVIIMVSFANVLISKIFLFFTYNVLEFWAFFYLREGLM